MTLSQLKARAAELGLTAAFVNKTYGGTQKHHWETAIMNREAAATNAALAAEAEEENRLQTVARAYQSASAALIVPLGIGMAVGTMFLRNAHGMLTRK